MTQVSPQYTNRQTAWVKTMRWLLLFVAGTIVGFPFVFVGPYNDEAADFLIYSILFWLEDRFPNSISFFPTRLTIASGLFAGTYTFDVWVLTIILTALYFGAIVAFVGSGNKRQALLGAGLVIIYLIATCYVLYRRLLGVLD